MKKLIQLLIAVSVAALLGSVAGAAANGTLAGKVEVAKGKKGQNTVVYLKGVQGEYTPPSEPAVLNQKNKVFIPHLLPLQRGQAVRFKNSDTLTHNVHLYWGKRSMLNKSQAPNSYDDWTPKRTGEHLILCNIHQEMMAALLVFDHPFFASIDSSEFKIESIPEGTYTLVAVREVKGKLKEKTTEVTIKGGETTKVAIQF